MFPELYQVVPWITAVSLGLLLSFLPFNRGVGLVVGTAVFVLVLIHPLVGVGLTLLLGPLGAAENLLWGGSSLDSGQVMLFITTFAWLIQSLSRRRITIPHTRLTAPLLLFGYVATLTIFDAPLFDSGFKEVGKWVEIGLLMLITVDLTSPLTPHSSLLFPHSPFAPLSSLLSPHSSLPPYFPILLILLLGGLSQALVGIWQFGLRGDGPEHFIILGRFYRAYGTFEQPNPFGGFMNLTALLAIGAFLGVIRCLGVQVFKFSREHLFTWTLAHLFPLLVAVATLLALVFSWSRGAWMGFAAGTAVFILFWPQKRWKGAVLLGLAIIVLAVGLQFGLIPASIAERLNSFRDDFTFGDVRGVDINDENYAVLERLAHWQAALDMAQEQPWLGVGFGNYEPAYADHALINWPYPLGHAHNYYLNLLAETGAVGLAAYLVLWTAVFWQTIRLVNQLQWPHRGVALGLLAAWVALATHHLVDKLYVNNIYIHLGVMLGLLQLLDPTVLRQKRETKTFEVNLT